MEKYKYQKVSDTSFEIIHEASKENIATAPSAEKADFLTKAANKFEDEEELREAYEWWEYLTSTDENRRLIKKYYPDEPTGYPRFFMDTDKLRIYRLENGQKGF